ncbi:hypothetical protein [Phyllobacterium zundukense]|uniref:Uncharacterized protein n=1 Tax=Phyllobacterium zundukense TaxID=1867719 RepID=A0ACD4CX49_9HYPH|nr:hypothetical protein [Phyllobacterium zundukense]UXN58149.1 hypothetical protein N8E88_04815 [Phyllobacterium zundukense]
MAVVEGWNVFTEEEAIKTAIDKYGKDPTTSVAYCTVAVDDGRKSLEFQFWFDLFLKLTNAAHIGGAYARVARRLFQIGHF